MGKRGAFICIEGLDASGKTTHSHYLVDDLRRRGFKAVYTTEPSPGKIGEFIRAYVLHRKKRVSSVVEALLFAGDRVDHVERLVEPALQKGKIVVCDRYLYSSLAYQGAAGLNLNWIRQINRNALTPDLAIYLDVPPEVVLKRMRRKKSVMERLQIQRKVEEIYMQLVEDGLLVRVEGNRAKDEVSKSILAVALDFLKG
jgi:dTMP kinase